MQNGCISQTAGEGGYISLASRWGPLWGWLALVLIYAWPSIASSCRVAPCFFSSSRARRPFFHIFLALGVVEDCLNLDCFTRRHLNFSKHSTHDFKTSYFRFSLSPCFLFQEGTRTITQGLFFFTEESAMLSSLLLLSILSFGFGISWKMAKTHFVPGMSDLTSKRLCFCNALFAAALFSGLFFIGSVFTTTDYIERISRWQLKVDAVITPADRCKAECRPKGSEALPKGLVRTTSNLDMRPLWGFPKTNPKESKNLLAIPVGIKQKESVNQIIKKFLPSGFVVMLFHYDGEVDAWRDLPWSKSVIHVSAASQTKWWFAKRFLHPDVVTEYEYIFLWDEDLGVEHFDLRRYISIVKEEGLEISQPALGPHSETHHQITKRVNNTKAHRKTNKSMGNRKCYENSTAPPCAGWVEMMAPVFTRAAWRCTWYMIQNDLIHAWGLDYNLGYCAQGNRSKNVGVVDSEYVFHEGVATLGGAEKKGVPENPTARWAVRRHSSVELEEFKRRWRKAAKKDECWTDPYS